MKQIYSHNLSERQQKVLDATLEIVVAEGMLKTSISKIAKRAKSSPGIIYHYFEDKDQIMHTLYRNIFREMMVHLLSDLDLEQACLERYKNLWIRKYQYHFNNPAQTVFIEQYKNSSYYTKKQEQETSSMMTELIAMVQNDVKRGLVVNLPLNVIYTMTLTVAINLAKFHIQENLSLGEDTLDLIAKRVCSSVLA